ncbi:MAG: hypothetical protein ACK5DM_08340, partial [Planctomyces sp.]
IRVHSWFKKHTTREDPPEQISGWKARATKIRDHSCSFVVQKTHLTNPVRTDLGLESPIYMKFVFICVHSWFKKHTLTKPRQGRSRAGRPEPHEIRDHSCSFVVQNHPQNPLAIIRENP